MKIENATPNIIQLKLCQEKTDNDYGTCLWANVVIDRDNYTLFIESDCGNYSYGWTPTPQAESFVKLLCRMDSDYLLSKISDTSYFDFDESKKQTIQNVREYFDNDDEAQRIIESLDYELDCCYGEETFYIACSNELSEYSDELIHIEKDYPAGAKKIVEIFKNTIQPYLREEFLNRENEMPAANVQEAKHGRWEKKKVGRATLWFCSECDVDGGVYSLMPKLNYCPSCGAKMDG